MRGAWILVGAVSLAASCLLSNDFEKVDAPPTAGGAGGTDVAGGGGTGGQPAGGSGPGGGEPCPSKVVTGGDCVPGLEFDPFSCCVEDRDCGFDPVLQMQATCNDGVCAAYLTVDNDGLSVEGRGLVVYGDELAWANGTTGSILVTAKDEPLAPIQTLATSAEETMFVVTDGGYVFWTSNGSPDIMRVDSGAMPERVGTIPGGLGVGFGRIALFDETLYVAQDQDPGGIWRLSAYETDMTANKLADAVNPEGITVDEDWIYFTEPEAAVVQVVERGGGTAMAIATGQTGASHLTSDADTLYWSASGAIRKMPKVGGPVVDLATGPGIDGRAVMVDDHFVYWVEFDGQNASAYRASKGDGSGRVTLVEPTVADAPFAMAQDCDHVFVSLLGGQILRVTK